MPTLCVQILVTQNLFKAANTHVITDVCLVYIKLRVVPGNAATGFPNLLNLAF